MARTASGKVDPRLVLSRAARWLRGLGGVIAAAGIVALTMVLMAPDDGSSSHLWRTLRAAGAIGGWLIPGLLMITFSVFIPRRKRGAITGAEVVTYVQMFFAGALIVFSLLHVKGLWPMLLIGLVWVMPLSFTHHFTAPCSHAMDMLAQLVTLGVEETRISPRRESRRGK